MTHSAPDCDYGGLMKSIEAVDEFTVKFTMCSPDPAFLAKIAFSSFGIQPKEYLESLAAVGAGSAAAGEADWHRPLHGLRMERVATRVDLTKPSRITGVKRPRSSDPGLQAGALRRPSVCSSCKLARWTASTTPARMILPAIEGDSNLQLITRPALNVFYVGMNNTFPPFDNEKVRQAIAMGIDRQRIVDNFYPAGSEVASHFTPCAIPNGCVGDAWYEFDVEQLPRRCWPKLASRMASRPKLLTATWCAVTCPSPVIGRPGYSGAVARRT